MATKTARLPRGWVAPFTRKPATGWHLVLFQNGDVALANLKSNGWDFGGNEPASPIVGWQYLGANIAQASKGLSSAIGDLQKVGLSGPWVQLIAAVDHGEPALIGLGATFTQRGKPVGTSGQTGSEAQAINPLPNVSLPCSPTDIGCWLGKLFGGNGLWRLAEFVFGVILLIMGLRQLASAAGGSQKIVLQPGMTL